MAALDKGLRILVVEDNPGDFVLIQEYLLEGLDHPDIVNAKTFAETVKHLEKEFSFDAILLDLSLPDSKGEKLVNDVVDLSEFTPVIVLTGYENKEFGLKTLSMGVADYLLKDELRPFMLGKVIAYSIERNKVHQSLQKSEKKYRDIFNLSPQPMFLIDVEARTIKDVNEATIKNYGYTKEEFLGLHLKEIRPSEEIPHFTTEIDKIDSNTSQFYHTRVKHQRKNGEVFDVELSTSEITLDGKPMRMALAEDVTEKLKAERLIKLKSDLLAANAKVAGSLIKNENWLDALNQTLGIIGNAVDVDRVYYFENHTDPETGEMLTSQRIEWSNDQVESQIDNPELQNIKMIEFEELFPKLQNKEVYQALVKNVEDSKLKSIFEDQNIVSILHFPIFVDGEFHGYIGFDDCTKERIWSDEEVQYLQTSGANIASAIKLRNTTSELRLSEQRFKAMIQDGSDIIGILDEDFKYTYISPTAASVFKVNPDDFIGLYALEYVHYDDRERVLKSVKKLNSQDRIFIDPYRVVDKEGEWHWIETIVTNLLDEPSIDGYVVNSRDVTKQMERESKLKELSLVASKTNDIVIITDPDEKITWVNQAFEKLTEYSLEECMGKKPGDFLQGPDTNPETKQRIKRAVQNNQPIEEVILNYSKSGSSYWLEMSISPIFDDEGNCTHFIAIERDVTEKIEKQKEYKESLERYDIVSKATSDTIWDLNLNEDVILYNENIHNIFGYDKTEVHNTGEWWRNNLHPEDRPHVNQKIRKVITNGIERFQLDYRFKTAEGNYKYIYDRAFLIKDETGEPMRMIGAMQDVTQDAEEQERLKLLESVITNTNESVVITEAKPSDKPGRKILYVNEAFSTLTGYDRKEVVGKSLHFLNGSKTDAKEREKLRRNMEKYQPCEAEFINYKKSGEEFHIHSSYVPVSNTEGEYTHWVAIGHDVTEERLQEKELKASLHEKETLLAEIHHRVKNNLAVVSSLIQMQAMNSQDPVLNNQLMEGVLRIKSMAAIHEQLYQAKSFSKLQFSNGLENLIGNIVETLQTDTDIELVFNLRPVELNINQGVPCSLLVNEVLSNILKHGFEGRKNGLIEVNLSQKDDVVELIIRDNGVGLPEDFGNKKRKTMGLELIDLLTQQLEGKNEFISSDQGTTFALSFEKTDIKGVGSALIT